MNDRSQRIQKLYESLLKLTSDQLSLVETITFQLAQPYLHLERLTTSDLINDCMLETLGDALRIHHCFSKEPLSKDRFEYALERSVNICGYSAELAPKGNPGHDITINNERFSLKTEAAKNIRADFIHISKFMELGKGEWNLDIQRQRYFRHTDSYDRILTFRCLSKKPTLWHYELVEIPKSLLLEATSGRLRIAEESRQNPKPFHYYVYGEESDVKYQLYFDGGTERKLQIQNLRKSFCLVHASWIFASEPRLDSQLPLDIG
jgi:type II restriction enzyme